MVLICVWVFPYITLCTPKSLLRYMVPYGDDETEATEVRCVGIHPTSYNRLSMAPTPITSAPVPDGLHQSVLTGQHCPVGKKEMPIDASVSCALVCCHGKGLSCCAHLIGVLSDSSCVSPLPQHTHTHSQEHTKSLEGIAAPFDFPLPSRLERLS